MNNRGFTLVELLAVIIIISLLALLANTSVTKVVRDSKSELYESQIKMIKLAAESWGSENIDKLPDSGQCKYLTLGDLKNYGLLDSSVKNPKTDKEFSNDMNIKITATENKFGKTNISYEVDSDDISECEIALEKTLDGVCKYDKTSTVPEKAAGAKYTCEVKPGTRYNFYVLTTPKEGDTTINLIMDQNINSDGTPAGMTGVTQETNASQYNSVAWNKESGQSTNAYGPVTAMTFLYNATKDWTNIEPVNYTYNDKTTQGTTAENTSYTSFVSSNGIATITPLTGDGVTIGSEATPLRARMPIYASDTTITEVASKTDANAYLYDNLRTNNVGPYSYWTLSSDADNSLVAWSVNYYGLVEGSNVGNVGGRGVRAVITLKLN